MTKMRPRQLQLETLIATFLLNYAQLMEADGGAIIDLLYTRGSFTAQHVAAEMGDGITTMDVSVQMMELMQQGLVRDSGMSPPSWRLTEAGNEVGRRRKSKAAG